MADSGKAFTDPHDEDEIDEVKNNNNGDPETDASTDDEDMEVGTNQVDDLYRSAMGNNPDGKNIDEAVKEDEEEIVKDSPVD